MFVAFMLVALPVDAGSPPTPSVVAAKLLSADRWVDCQSVQVERIFRQGGGKLPDHVVFRERVTFLFDGMNSAIIRMPLFQDGTQSERVEEVDGSNDNYSFTVRRGTGHSWQLHSVSPLGSERRAVGELGYWRLNAIQGRRLADLIEDPAFVTSVRAGEAGEWVLDGRRREDGEGLQTFTARLRHTANYAYVISSSSVLMAGGRREVLDAVNRVREDVIPVPEHVVYSVQTTDAGVSDTALTESEYHFRLTLDGEDRAKFRLPYYGLPEPDLTPPTPFSPVPMPPATRTTYTWILLLPVAGVVLLVIANVLLKKRKPPTPSTPPAGGST